MKKLRALSTLFHFPDIGLLLLRLMVGVVGIFHGAQKLFGVFGGSGIEGFAKFLESLNIPFPTASAVMAGLAEFGGGLLIAIGFFTRFASLSFGFTMAVAVWSTYKGVFDVREGGIEYPLFVGVACAALFFAGPGALSLDTLAAKMGTSSDKKD